VESIDQSAPTGGLTTAHSQCLDDSRDVCRLPDFFACLRLILSLCVQRDPFPLPPDAAARDGVGVLSLALSPACANSATSPRHTRPPPPLHVTPDHCHLCAIGSDQESSTAKAIERAPSASSRSPLDLGWFVCFYSPHSYLRPPLFVCCPCLDLSGCFVSLPLFVVDLSTHRLAHAFFSSLLLVDAACSLTHW
jgi:hypothetical protein